MPIYVDHEQRRADLAEIAYLLIAKGGVEAATIRKVADAAGYSTTIVSHYYANKKDLLLSTLKLSVEKSQSYVDAASLKGGLKEVLEAFLPIDQYQRQNWRIWIAFWAASLTDSDMAKQQRNQLRVGRDWLKTYFQHSPELTLAHSDSGLDKSVRRTLTLIVGLSTQASLDSRNWSAEKLKENILEHIADLKNG
jgi:AcrR family transcriptional regulator